MNLSESRGPCDGGVSHAVTYAKAFPCSSKSTGGNKSAMPDFDALTQLGRADGIGKYVGTC